MSTANYTIKNARDIYALNDRSYYNPETGEPLDEWTEGCEVAYLDGDELAEDIANFGESEGWTETSDRDGAILERTFWMRATAADEEESFTAKIIIRPGYYCGANLDYEIESSRGLELSDYDGDEDAFAEDLTDGELDDLRYYNGWNEGLCRIQRPNIAKKYAGILAEIIETCEAFCKKACDAELAVVGRFSNGETLYSRVA